MLALLMCMFLFGREEDYIMSPKGTNLGNSEDTQRRRILALPGSFHCISLFSEVRVGFLGWEIRE